jgi:hypothetical protein
MDRMALRLSVLFSASSPHTQTKGSWRFLGPHVKSQMHRVLLRPGVGLESHFTKSSSSERQAAIYRHSRCLHTGEYGEAGYDY